MHVKDKYTIVVLHVWYWDRFHDYSPVNCRIAGYIVNSGWRGWYGQAGHHQYKIYWTICTDRILYWIWGKKTQINRSFWSKVQSSFIVNSQFNKFYFLPKILVSHEESSVLRKPFHLAELLSQLLLFWNMQLSCKICRNKNFLFKKFLLLQKIWIDKYFTVHCVTIVAHKLHFCKVDSIIYTCSLDIYNFWTSML